MAIIKNLSLTTAVLLFIGLITTSCTHEPGKTIEEILIGRWNVTSIKENQVEIINTTSWYTNMFFTFYDNNVGLFGNDCISNPIVFYYSYSKATIFITVSDNNGLEEKAKKYTLIHLSEVDMNLNFYNGSKYYSIKLIKQ